MTPDCRLARLNAANHCPPIPDATGCKWWRVDFHAHTPHSWDAHRTAKNKDAQATITEREWLLAHMEAGLDVVAVTDHNGGGWIDRLKVENEKLNAEKPAGFRPLTLFPGVEITVSDGFHLLVLLDPRLGSAEITALLGTSIDVGDHGSHEAKSRESVETLLDRLSTQDCLAIPAHVNGPKGLLRDKVPNHPSEPGEVILQTDSRTRERVLQHRLVCALESYRKTPFEMAQCPSAASGQRLAVVYGSDSHERDEIGRCSTWVRMSAPTLSGLRVALLDGAASVQQYKAGEPSPGPNSPWCIRSVSISGTRHIGLHDGQPKPVTLELNPSFNAIIGGRGTGKSSIVELIRKATKRDTLLERAGGEPARNHTSLLKDIAEGMTGVSVQVDYELHGKVFRMEWRGAESYVLSERQADGVFLPVENGGTWTERFPLRIFSQKQLYATRDRTDQLLDEIDAAAEVSGAAWQREWDRLLNEFIQCRARMQALQAQLRGRADIEAKLADRKRQLEALEKSGHKGVLQELALRRRQRAEVGKWEKSWEGIADAVRELADRLDKDIELGTPLKLSRKSDEGDSVPEAAVEAAAVTLVAAIQGECATLTQVAGRIDAAVNAWRSDLASSRWVESEANAEEGYTTLVQQLQGSGTRPEQYGQLVQECTQLRQQLDSLKAVQQQLEETQKSQKECFKSLQDHRAAQTTKRRGFLAAQFRSNQRLRAELAAFGDLDAGVRNLRSILSREAASDAEFDRMTAYLKASAGETELSERLGHLKKHLVLRTEEAASATGLKFGAQFLSHLESRTSEDMSRVWAWFPPDYLRLSYRMGDTGNFKPLDKGSPGQVAAAVLAFLLAYGEEPMILDQPEDDLDNRLIYDLIVGSIHTNKLRRQLIIVTHNPNIVVNGNADLVCPLEDRAGQTAITCRGSLQSEEVRRAVCDIMEGGREALERRFRQIVH